MAVAPTGIRVPMPPSVPLAAPSGHGLPEDRARAGRASGRQGRDRCVAPRPRHRRGPRPRPRRRPPGGLDHVAVRRRHRPARRVRRADRTHVRPASAGRRLGHAAQPSACRRDAQGPDVHDPEHRQGGDADPGLAPRRDCQPKRSLEFIEPADHSRAIASWLDMLAAPGSVRRVRLRHRHRDGSWVWFEISNHNRLHDPAARRRPDRDGRHLRGDGRTPRSSAPASISSGASPRPSRSASSRSTNR